MLAAGGGPGDTRRVSHRVARRGAERSSAQSRTALAAIAAILGLATLVGIILLRPTGDVRGDLRGLGITAAVYEAEVVAVRDTPCPDQPAGEAVCRRFAFQLTEGPDAGQLASQVFVVSATTPTLERGDGVLLAHDPAAQEGFRYRYYDRDRTALLVWLAAMFAAAVVILGRLRGLAALAGLAASFAVIIFFVLPAIMDGRDPLAVSIVGAAAIAFLALYLAHGFTTMTTVALLGTLGSLAITAALAGLFVGLAEVSGFASDEAIIVQLGAARVDLQGIVLGGVVIGALGAIDDMTVTQASAVWELRAVDPMMGRRSLLRSGLRIGRDHVASTVNTLALAYAGASMPILLLLVLSRQSVEVITSGEVIATEIVRTLIGSMGLVAAVPLTTWLASRAAPGAAEAEARGIREPARPVSKLPEG
jgi:uncharacterized membrane protein